MLRLAVHTDYVPVFSSPMFSTPVNLVPRFPVLHFPPLQFGPAFSSRAFSSPAFSVAPICSACLSELLFQWVRFHAGNNNSGKVAIWSMAPIRDENAENDENVPKSICQMDNHLGMCR